LLFLIQLSAFKKIPNNKDYENADRFMKTLIVYYSFSGNNRVLARYLQTKLGADLQKIEELKSRTGFTILLDILFKRTPKIAGSHINWHHYDRIIFTAPIWAGKIASPMQAFLKLEKDNITQYSFISLCGTGGNKKISSALTELVQHAPTAVLELRVNDLIPPEKKNKILYTSGYKVQEQDFAVFDRAIDKFLQVLQPV
jgi:flavodoxin